MAIRVPAPAEQRREFDVEKYIRRLRRAASVGAMCPECGGPLVRGEGCALCPVCGFSNCG